MPASPVEAAAHWDALYHLAAHDAAAAFSPTVATFEFATLRCSVRCPPGGVARLRVRYVAGERMHLGVIPLPAGAAPGHVRYGALLPGVSAAPACEDGGEPCNAGALLRCDGEVFCRGTGFDPVVGEPRVCFVPGQTMVLVADRKRHVLSVAPDVAAAPLVAICTLPVATADLRFVVAHVGGACCTAEVVPPETTPGGGFAPPPTSGGYFGPRAAAAFADMERLADRATE
jgi:hypothetical protein